MTVPEGEFGFGRNVRFAPGTGQGRSSRQFVVERNRLEARPLDLGERPVEDVARRRRDDQPALGHEGPREDRQDVVGAVADQDRVGIDAQHAARGLAERVAERVGILAEPVAGERGADRLEDPRAGGYGFSLVLSLTMSGSLSCSPGT